MPPKRKTNQTKRTKKKRSSRPQRPRDDDAPVNVGFRVQTSAPRFRASTRGCRVQHSELIRGLTNSNGAPEFFPAGFPLQPGDQRTFPWLSNIASSWARYRIHSMTWHLRSTLPSTFAGYTLMSLNSDPADPDPTSKQTMAMNPSAVETKVWQHSNASIPQAVLRNQPPQGLYVRKAGQQQDDAEKRLSDLGTFYIIGDSTSLGAGLLLADIWVTYDVEFFIPSAPASQGVAYITSGGGATSVALPLGILPTVTNAEGTLLPSATGDTIFTNLYSPMQILFDVVGTAVTDVLPTYVLENGTIENISILSNPALTFAQVMFRILPDPGSLAAPVLSAIDFTPTMATLTQSSVEVLMIAA